MAVIFPSGWKSELQVSLSSPRWVHHHFRQLSVRRFNPKRREGAMLFCRSPSRLSNKSSPNELKDPRAANYENTVCKVKQR
jgi:hypothetical protein